jgi:hypothetical protein
MEPESGDIQGANNMNILHPWIEKAHDKFLLQSLQSRSMRLELLLIPPIYTVVRRHESREQLLEREQDLERDGKLFLTFGMQLAFRFPSNVPSILGEFAGSSCLAPRSCHLGSSRRMLFRD